MSTSSYSASPRLLANSCTQRATGSPRRPGRVLPRMIATLVTEVLKVSGFGLGLTYQPESSQAEVDTSTRPYDGDVSDSAEPDAGWLDEREQRAWRAYT